MQTWIALLRGVNVGGHRKLPMADLRAALAAEGLADVATYIQSGNLIFTAGGEAGALAERIASVIARAFGFETDVLVFPAERLAAGLVANPFPEAEDDPARLYIHFPFGEIAPLDEAGLAALASRGERFALVGGLFYLHAPEGVGRSDLAARLERFINVPTTARNLRSCRKMLELAGGAGA